MMQGFQYDIEDAKSMLQQGSIENFQKIEDDFNLYRDNIKELMNRKKELEILRTKLKNKLAIIKTDFV